jgi:hypothetical protein
VIRNAAGPRAVYGPEAEQYVNVPAHQVAACTHGGYTYVTHDYCRTLPRAQGATIDRVVVAADAESSAFCKQWGNVAFTRHREDVRIHLSAAGMRREHAPTHEPAHWPREARQEAAADRGQDATPEFHRLTYTPEPALDDKARAEALEEAASRLTQDRPGPSTLDYQETHQVESGQEMDTAGSALEAAISEGPAPEHDAREEVTAESNHTEGALEEVAFEPELAIVEGGI